MAPDRRWSQRIPLRPQHVEGKGRGRAGRFDTDQVEEVKSFLRALIARTRSVAPGLRSNF